VLALTVEAGAAPMQAMLGEPDGSIGSSVGSPSGSNEDLGEPHDG
jgi:hypothetical protein